jgi:hypothetical protein
LFAPGSDRTAVGFAARVAVGFGDRFAVAAVGRERLPPVARQGVPPSEWESARHQAGAGLRRAVDLAAGAVVGLG